MHALLRSLFAIAIAAAFVAACSAGATSTPAPTPTPTLTPTPTATPAPTPTPTPTPAAVVDPKGWTFFTWSGGFDKVSSGTDDGRGTLAGAVVKSWVEAPDARVSGYMTAQLSIKYGAGGEIGLEYGTITLENAGGSWAGTCGGAAWGDASDVTCWLTGRGAYSGFTLYHHVRTKGFSVDATDLVYKGSPPK